ncbi:hypothetical protein FK220_006555 [Flavobacteriaceae bacterium TP-CH-4]|uniref:Fibronectin type-III domain-containing protein n=1 Tax=Pelagihabitans pacificus TaxID=2696054 RepID=A0A967AWQ7_9FLAO|nr:hypothetical protein [Pelagihabitans pacificus]NHF58992.1 hypothetical protein [Pelagihabitans pacificus]
MKRFLSISLIGLLLSSIGCDDVLEEDISDDSITIIAPLDQTALEGNTVQFRWNPLEGADDYRIQITGEQQFLVLDSLVSTSVFDYQIDPGTYRWRVRGENFAYTTPYTFEATFSIAASLDLSGQQIALTGPADNVYFNETGISFSWKAITTADSYVFQLLEQENATETLVFEDDNVTGTSLTLSNTTITEDAEYLWQVKGVNVSSETAFSSRSFFIDRENPPAPVLATPSNDESFNVNDMVDFTWNFTDTGEIQSSITSTIEISSDEDFTVITSSDTNSDGEFSSTFTMADTYYWRVRGEDAAGNTGQYSVTGSFIVN